MKRFILWILCLLLLVTGCASGSGNPTEQGTDPTSGTVGTLPPERPGVPLLDQAEAVGGSKNLRYIPNPHLESMSSPQIRLYGNGLLLYEHTADGRLQIKRISLEDGCLQAEASYPVSASAQVQVGSGMIGLCDNGSGQVLILNEMLELETACAFPVEGDFWYLNQEMEVLYEFFAEKGVLCRELATGKTQWILDNAAFVQPFGAGSGYVLFSYTDRTDQKTYNRCLNLSTATMETVPVEGAVDSATRSGEQWLFRQDVASGDYVLVNQDSAGIITWPSGSVELISGRRQLLVRDENGRDLGLYDLSGNFLSRCNLPQKDQAAAGTELVWSGYWQGYFFRDTYNGAAHLMFWDPGIQQEGENLSILDLGSVQTPEPVMEKALYQKAEELSRRFGVNIRIAEQCSLEYSHYEADALTDPYFVRKALDVLEAAFSAYPDGFFRQLPHGNMLEIRVDLVASLRGKEGMDTHPTSIGGFAQSMTDHYLIVLDGFSIQRETVYHEVSHIIDKRLEWDAMLRSGALYGKETWLSLQPKGFRYAESYTNIPAEILSYENSGYFAGRYAMTFPTEDRATLMELAMSDSNALKAQPAMAEKMRYYAACIRDCFDTKGWPAKTLWE